jgi:Arc/MetJ-type ribon-helix-helix transcriptional regulator
MKSVRLDADLERKLEAVSFLEGRSQSEVIRAAVERYCAEAVARRADVAWAPSLGVAQLPTSVARRTGEAFTTLLQAKRRSRRRTAR